MDNMDRISLSEDGATILKNLFRVSVVDLDKVSPLERAKIVAYTEAYVELTNTANQIRLELALTTIQRTKQK